MIEISRILCPIDFSDASRHAWDHAVTLAGWYGSRIAALHVCNPVFLANPPILFAEPARTPVLTDADRSYLKDRLRDWVAPAQAAGLSADMLFDEGSSPAGSILAHAQSLPADLIVMSTHGRGGFERLVLGSVAEKVLRKARCPVLTVPLAVVST